MTINCSAINNSVVLVDPASLSIVNTIFISKDEFKMGKSVSKVIFNLIPSLNKIKKGETTYDKIFKGFVTKNIKGITGVKMH